MTLPEIKIMMMATVPGVMASGMAHTMMVNKVEGNFIWPEPLLPVVHACFAHAGGLCYHQRQLAFPLVAAPVMKA